MPMFPLGSVLLPGEKLPLHVFEPRYRAMVEDALTAAGDGEPGRFGVVLIERGHEVGGGDTRGDVATTAVIEQCLPLPDGRYVLDCVGVERLRVTRWLEDDPYPRAVVSVWPDDTDRTPADMSVVVQKAETLMSVLTEIASARDVPPPHLPSLAGVESGVAESIYRFAAALPLGPSDRLAVLSAPTVSARVAALAEAIDDVIAVAEFSRMPPG